MKERPILFSAPMVRALLDGSKTQTRRVVKPQPYIDAQGNACWNGSNFGQDSRGPHIQALTSPIPSSKTGRVRCPYGKAGDQLWVRESFCRIDGQTRPWIETDYRATYKHGDRLGDTLGIKKRWTPSIHMPRHASRITLQIVSVRVERLQDISEVDAISEGIEKTLSGFWSLYGQASVDGTYSPRASYRALWESINGHGSWDANPWVWVVEFKRVTP